MKKHYFISLTFSLILILSLMTSCGFVSTALSESSGSDTETCDAGDADCFQESLRLIDEDGAEIDLVDITVELPAASSSSSAPAITSVDIGTDSDTMILYSTSVVQQLWITFTDPLGSRPAFCMQTCPKNVMCTTSGYRCSRSFPDGLVSGTYKTWLGYQAEPADSTTTEELVLSIIPISSPDGSDPIGIIEEANNDGQDTAEIGEDQIVVGTPIEIDQTVTAETDDDDDDSETGTSSEGASCTSSSQCSGDCFTSRSCIRGLSCSCAGSASSGTCYDLSCSGLGETCGDGVSACCVGLSCTNGECVDSSTDSCY